VIRRFGAVAGVLAAVLWAAAAGAGEHLTGIVLMTPSTGEVVIHHAPFDGMPAMTMTFRVPAQTRLNPGDRVSADVDRSSEPWSLARIVMQADESTAPPPPAPVLARVGDAVPDAAFIDQRGRSTSLSALRGAPLAVSFIYSRCRDAKMCPLVSGKFRMLQARLKSRAALVEITLDPAYDRPPILARYGSVFGADPSRWHLLTGEPKAVLDLAARFGILEQAAGAVQIVHSERLAIVGANGRIVRFFDGAAWSAHDVLAALRL
jgi:cytochrome oxidase Cu insertion factor (SCO1/SenC/PrrC family)/Cu/Ag efflux protein CusF